MDSWAMFVREKPTLRVDWWGAWCAEDVGILDLIDAGVDPNGRDKDGATSLFPPAVEGDPSALDAIIAAGANVNAHNDAGETPILLAAKSGNEAIVRKLMKAGAKLRVRDDNGATPLHFAARWGQSGMIEAMCEPLEVRDEDGNSIVSRQSRRRRHSWKLNPNARDGTGRTPLHFAVDIECNSEGVHAQQPSRAIRPMANVSSLVAAGANPNALDETGTTPLQVAASSVPGAVRLLLELGASATATDRNGVTALHGLVMDPSEKAWVLQEALSALVEAGADPNAADNEGLTPLHWLVEHYYPFDEDPELRVFTALVEAGADPSAADNQGKAPLHRLPVGEYDQEGVVTRALIEAGANVNARDDKGRTPLHCAASTDIDCGVLKALLAGDANVNAHDADGRTPLHVAVEEGDSEVASVLVAAGADPFRRTSTWDWSPFDAADERGISPEMAVAFVGDPNKRDQDGRTPLHRAAADGMPSLLVALLEADGDPNVRDQNGRTPLHEAEWNPACIEALVEKGADPDVRDKDGQEARGSTEPRRRSKARGIPVTRGRKPDTR